jgi:hypothetical protein
VIAEPHVKKCVSTARRGYLERSDHRMLFVLTESQIRGLLDLVVQTSQAKRDNLGHLYLAQAGAELPAYLAEYYEREPRADVRVDLLTFASPFAGSDARVLELASRALFDRSSKVREKALWLFARSGRRAALPFLRSWRPQDENDSAYRERAVKAIEQQDVQEWVRVTRYSSVGLWQFSQDTVGSEPFKASVDRYIKRDAADLAPDLERILEDLYLAP